VCDSEFVRPLWPSIADSGRPHRALRFELPIQLYGAQYRHCHAVDAAPAREPCLQFIYEYDPATGVYSRSAESFGPVLTERAETIGRHKFYFGGTFQRFRFNKLDGVDLHNFHAVLDHQITAATGDWPEQFISTQNSIDLKINQFTVFGTFGLTNKIDLSVDIPFVQVGYNLSSSATINRIVNTEPIFTPGANGISVDCCASSGGPGPYGPN
jgi:hypothetical protein